MHFAKPRTAEELAVLLRAMENLVESYPRLFWAIEKLFGSLVTCALLCCLRACWRSARANQKLALSDVCDYSLAEYGHAECRGLLLPHGSRLS